MYLTERENGGLCLTERENVGLYLTEREKSPAFFLLGRAKKLPWTPLLFSMDSASIPDRSLWNHLHNTHTHTCVTHTHTYIATIHTYRTLHKMAYSHKHTHTHLAMCITYIMQVMYPSTYRQWYTNTHTLLCIHTRTHTHSRGSCTARCHVKKNKNRRTKLIHWSNEHTDHIIEKGNAENGERKERKRERDSEACSQKQKLSEESTH